MHEAASARAALKLLQKGYKRVVVVEGGVQTMMSCGFKWWDGDKIKYKDFSGKVKQLGQ